MARSQGGQAVSDTPRTDVAEYESQDEPVTKLGAVDVDFARQLERELNAANDRIKRFEEAGIELRECASWLGHSCCHYVDQTRRAKAAIEAWDKEVK
jgi:hypothetical protein